jgi:DNA-binding NarL/FixJ family response regulator
MKVSGQMVAHDIQVVAPTRLETAAALLTLAAICARAGRTADARDRISQAAALIAQCPDPDILASQLAAAQHRAAPLALIPPPRGRARRPDGLSAREAEVLQLLTSGSTNLEIAAALVVSVHTVERHLQNAYRKIGVRNRADAAAYMARHESPRPDGRKLLRQ